MPPKQHRDLPGTDRLAAVAAEDRKTTRYLSIAGIAICALVAGLGGWAALTRISGAVIANAKVAVEANSKSIQHINGGVVRSIAVRDGQAVKKGDLLAEFDPQKLNDQIRGTQSQVNAKAKQLALMKSELEDLHALERKRLVPRSQVAAAQRELSQLEGELGRLQAELANSSTDKSRLEIRSPITGRIHNLAIHTVGGVVRPGQEILRIVPSGAPLILEAKVDPADIDQIRNGQSVTVRMTSFNQRNTPELAGTVQSASADLVADESKERFHYLVRITLNPGEVERLEGKPLIPGMPATVFIRADERTVLSFILKPLSDQMQRAMREE
ncbi:MAG: efflux RND transporter periplasmic adaptor subunit [Alphaproteobacteria bacterium]|nr:efflux RND transporter periplasmic adaptor subunit [Alphaproteobacteria bacterium]